MPSTLLGVAILVVLLGPGFCYVAAKERRWPARQVSPFRDSVQIAAASIVLDLLAVLAFWAARSLWPHSTPVPGPFISAPHSYWLIHYRLLIGWSAGLFAFACGVGLSAGSILRPRRGSVHESGWWRMFAAFPKSRKWVGCELLDGTYLRGELYSYSLDPEETEDRELVIRDPKYRPANGEESDLGSALTCVSARQMKFLSVTYQDPGSTAAPAPWRGRLATARQVLAGKVTIDPSGEISG
jgi:Family of unknown function (DUF6338)